MWKVLPCHCLGVSILWAGANSLVLLPGAEGPWGASGFAVVALL